MEDILYMAENLNNAIKTSDVYLNYKKAFEKIKNTDLENKIKHFMHQKIEFNLKKMQKIDVSLEEEKNIGKLYFDLCLNEDAKTFFDAEKVFLELMGKIDKITCSGIDIKLI